MPNVRRALPRPPLASHDNLRLISRAHVDHIELSDGRATGVIIVDTNGPRRIDADLVIVALGTYVIPAALLRSGIGPATELAHHNIPVSHELAAVGQGMQDHPKVSYRFALALPA